MDVAWQWQQQRMAEPPPPPAESAAAAAVSDSPTSCPLRNIESKDQGRRGGPRNRGGGRGREGGAMESMKDVSCALGRVEKRATIDRTETRRGEGDLLPPFISPPSLPPSISSILRATMIRWMSVELRQRVRGGQRTLARVVPQNRSFRVSPLEA